MKEQQSVATRGPGFFLPFLLGDGLLLIAAWALYGQASRPMTPYELGAFTLCVAFGAWLAVWPFRLRHAAELQQAETAELSNTLAQIQRVEETARRIELATGQWQTVQEHAGRTMTAAREITDRMAAEQKEFRAFMDAAQNAERDHLRLEVNKLRRGEGDWLQVVVRMLDHVYALYLAGLRSGQPNLAEQFTHFQNACRDAVRRVGLVILVAPSEAPYDADAFQLYDPNAPVPDGAVVAETVATGYSFQGKLLRRPVVVLKPAPASVSTPAGAESFGTEPPPDPGVTPLRPGESPDDAVARTDSAWPQAIEPRQSGHDGERLA